MTKKKSIPHWRTTTKTVVAENPFLTLEEHRREEEGTGKHGYFFIVHAPNWANVVAITENDELVLIEQFRQGSERVELEIPGGIIGENEQPDDSILRELVEETGYQISEKSEFRRIGEVIPNPAFIRNKCFTYLVTNVRPTGETHFDEHEHIRVRLVPRSEIEKLITSGEIQHSLVIAALYWMKLAGL
ncbi:MAG: NUDIX hydrolase [Bacteroidota bacterium]|nr:NUDIX hydrolase [Bacteroidota bacterium]MDP4231947.1 NUDIX hydrolase [Bacteroidota bacterium]MDP4241346.1 NUDIX hydrolase [Bacteroidota bacterium]MDP4287267.1 NUDIX hydrolase [Bacteroidota bacterium]